MVALSFYGDEDFFVECTGNCVVGDHVRFERAIFSGSYKKPKFSHYELVTAKIVKDSYGEVKQQHTFTLEDERGNRFLIKGRNLYSNRTWRKLWEDEHVREEALKEKYVRGNEARIARSHRRRAWN